MVQRPDQGFTLFELLAVLAIASVLAGVGIAGWRGSQQRLAISSTTNQIISMYQATRFQAIRRSAPVAIFLEGDEIVSFELPDGAVLNCANVDRTRPVGSTLNWREALPAGHTVNWNATEGVIWRPTGLAASCNNGGIPNATIRIQDNGGAEVARLTVAGTSGRIATQPIN